MLSVSRGHDGIFQHFIWISNGVLNHGRWFVAAECAGRSDVSPHGHGHHSRHADREIGVSRQQISESARVGKCAGMHTCFVFRIRQRPVFCQRNVWNFLCPGLVRPVHSRTLPLQLLAILEAARALHGNCTTGGPSCLVSSTVDATGGRASPAASRTSHGTPPSPTRRTRPAVTSGSSGIWYPSPPAVTFAAAREIH